MKLAVSTCLTGLLMSGLPVLSATPAQAAPGIAPAAVHLPAARPRASVLNDPRCYLPAKALCADKSTRKLYAVEHGKVVKTLAARFGRKGYRTREGAFRVSWKSRDHVSSIYKVPMPYAMFFSGGQAIHYSGRFRRVGYAGLGSHGCINIKAPKKIKWIYNWAPTGTRVVVTD